jgi:hypothetical protein
MEELYIGNLNHTEIKDRNGNHKKNITTCVSFFAKDDNEAIKNAKKFNLESFGKITDIKLNGKDF